MDLDVTTICGRIRTMTLPPWEVNELNALAQAGMLYHVPSIILQAMDISESGGQGGYINSLGFGGFFGLGANQPYPTGTLTLDQLLGTDLPSFIAQASVASGLFASLLTRNKGNVYAAETVYQGGSNFGVTVMESMGIPNFIPWPVSLQESNMYFIWDGKVYFAAGLLFEFAGNFFFADSNGGFQLVKNALAAVQASGVYAIPDISGGLHNDLIGSKTGKPKGVLLTMNGLAAAQAAAQNGNIVIIADIGAGLYNQFVVGNEG
jgi:hypothetical protein